MANVLLNKVNKVIQSCTTLEQLASAERYSRLYLNQIPATNINEVVRHSRVSRILGKDIETKREEIENEYRTQTGI